MFAARPCPDCGEPGPKFNRWLRTASLNAGLYAQANQAAKNR